MFLAVDNSGGAHFDRTQTGSGKTYTMAGSKQNPGVNIRALQKLFDIAAQRSSEHDTHISASYLEIYNETIFDLLSKEREGLTVKHSGAAGIEVAGLTNHPVASVAEVEAGAAPFELWTLPSSYCSRFRNTIRASLVLLFECDSSCDSDVGCEMR